MKISQRKTETGGLVVTAQGVLTTGHEKIIEIVTNGHVEIVTSGPTRTRYQMSWEVEGDMDPSGGVDNT